MLLTEHVQRATIVAPHADDEVLGCAGLMAKLGEGDCRVHVIYMAVDGMDHYGNDRPTTLEERLGEIESVAELLGFTYEIAYAGQGLIERLDTVPKRDLVDYFEQAFNKHRPEMLLLPYGFDYDQDHIAVFQTSFAAARPIAEQFGKWLIPHVLTYEMTKLNWAAQPMPRPVAFADISGVIELKLEALRRYATQLRPSPHIRSPESVRALAAIRGKEIGVEYAEAYGVLRSLI